MELTANQQMVLPIMATCLLARAASSLLSRKPVYRALADKLIEGYERELARRNAETSMDDSDDAHSAWTELSMVEDPATPIPLSDEPPHTPTPPTDHRSS